MSLLPNDASFHERVQDCFATYRGRGLALSAADLDLVDAWADADVPFDVVARGIRKAAEAALFDAPEGGGRLRSLRACRRAVDAEIARYLKRSVGRGAAPDAPPQTPFLLARHQKLRGTLQKLARDEPSVADAVARLAALPAPTDFQTSERQESLVLATLLRALPGPERLAVLREASRLVADVAPTSPAARRDSLRFHRGALVRRRLALPAFW